MPPPPPVTMTQLDIDTNSSRPRGVGEVFGRRRSSRWDVYQSSKRQGEVLLSGACTVNKWVVPERHSHGKVGEFGIGIGLSGRRNEYQPPRVARGVARHISIIGAATPARKAPSLTARRAPHGAPAREGSEGFRAGIARNVKEERAQSELTLQGGFCSPRFVARCRHGGFGTI